MNAGFQSPDSLAVCIAQLNYFRNQHGSRFSKRKEATDVNAKLFLQGQPTEEKTLMDVKKLMENSRSGFLYRLFGFI